MVCLFCLPLLVLILILYRYYLLWHPSKIESMHACDRSLSSRLPTWSLALMMSVTPSTCPPGTFTPSRASRATRATPTKVASGVVTASLSNEERTVTDTPSGSATNEEGASGSLGVSWSEEASASAEVPAPATAAASASSDEADSSESTPG